MKTASFKLKLASFFVFIAFAIHAKANQQPDKVEKIRFDITKPALNFSVFKLFTVQPQLKDSIEKSFKLERNPQPKLDQGKKEQLNQNNTPIYFIDRLRNFL